MLSVKSRYQPDGGLILIGKLRVCLPEFGKIIAQSTEHILHVHMSIVYPDFIVLAEFHLLDFLVRFALVDYRLVGDLIAILDWQQIMHHGLVCELMEKRGVDVHRTVDHQEHSAGPVGWRGEITLELCEPIQLFLHKSREMSTQDAGFMSRGSWPIVPNHGIFAQTGAERHDLSTYQYAYIGPRSGQTVLPSELAPQGAS